MTLNTNSVVVTVSEASSAYICFSVTVIGEFEADLTVELVLDNGLTGELLHLLSIMTNAWHITFYNGLMQYVLCMLSHIIYIATLQTRSTIHIIIRTLCINSHLLQMTVILMLLNWRLLSLLELQTQWNVQLLD